uniref:Uncharacterized protein n=1 Tax=Ditylenchus dipsaci TaxID=166011 RepID=A0A915EDG4_9BILA
MVFPTLFFIFSIIFGLTIAGPTVDPDSTVSISEEPTSEPVTLLPPHTEEPTFKSTFEPSGGTGQPDESSTQSSEPTSKSPKNITLEDLPICLHSWRCSSRQYCYKEKGATEDTYGHCVTEETDPDRDTLVYPDCRFQSDCHMGEYCNSMLVQDNSPGKCYKVGWRLTTTDAPTVNFTSETTAAPSVGNETGSITLEPMEVTGISTSDPSEEPTEYASSTPSGSANETTPPTDTSSSSTMPDPNQNISSSSVPVNTTSESITDQTGTETSGSETTEKTTGEDTTNTTMAYHQGNHTGHTHATEIPTGVTGGEVSEETTLANVSDHTTLPGEITESVSEIASPTTLALNENSSVVLGR